MQHVTITLPNGISYKTPAFTDEDGDVWVRNSAGCVVCVWEAANEAMQTQIGNERDLAVHIEGESHTSLCILAAHAALSEA